MDPAVHYPASRTGKRITLTACIAVDGSFLGACLVLSHKTPADEILTDGFVVEKVERYSRTKACITRDICDDWFRNLFIPDLIARRGRFSHHGPAFLIVQGVS
jgi:hypothetical protein